MFSLKFLSAPIPSFLFLSWPKTPRHPTPLPPPLPSPFTLCFQSFLSQGISVKAQECKSYCSAKTNCGSCAQDPLCGWCNNTCLTLSEQALCKPAFLWSGDKDCCSSCSTQSTCGECLAEAGCGWSFDLSKCISGNSLQELCIDSIYTVLETDNAQCNPPPGAIAGDGSPIFDPLTQPVTKFCSGNGDPNFLTGTCACDDGYHGSGCANECPGGANNSCNGHGICSKVTGICSCDCGWEGTACENQRTSCNCFGDDGACLYGLDCDQICGQSFQVSFSLTECSGTAVEVPPSSARRVGNSPCVCLDGWWGPECLKTCPGVTPSNSGSPCGGHGTCDVTTGVCSCDPCYSLSPNTGSCVEKPDPTCVNDGAPICNVATGEKTCSCKGQFQPPTCADCACENGGTCNSISGNCDCPPDWRGARCTIECSRENTCNGHGICNNKEVNGSDCICDAMWFGRRRGARRLWPVIFLARALATKQ